MKSVYLDFVSVGVRMNDARMHMCFIRPDQWCLRVSNLCVPPSFAQMVFWLGFLICPIWCIGWIWINSKEPASRRRGRCSVRDGFERGAARAYRVCYNTYVCSAGRMQARMHAHEGDQGPGKESCQLLLNWRAHVFKRISADHAWPLLKKTASTTNPKQTRPHARTHT